MITNKKQLLISNGYKACWLQYVMERIDRIKDKRQNKRS